MQFHRSFSFSSGFAASVFSSIYHKNSEEITMCAYWIPEKCTDSFCEQQRYCWTWHFLVIATSSSGIFHWWLPPSSIRATCYCFDVLYLYNRCDSQFLRFFCAGHFFFVSFEILSFRFIDNGNSKPAATQKYSNQSKYLWFICWRRCRSHCFRVLLSFTSLSV